MKERQENLAKLRSVLSHHEVKLKRIKKIKSKTYHRLLNKSKLKEAESSIPMDPRAAKEHASRLKFNMAKGRMTLKHRKSQWAKRILKRGVQVQDEGTRAAYSELLNQHASLMRKRNYINESSSSDDDDDSDEMSAGSDHDVVEKMIEKSKEKMRGVLQGDEEVPVSGVLSLPFMVRALNRRKEEAEEEAKLAIDELGDKSKMGRCEKSATNGRMVFGPKEVVHGARKKVKLDYYSDNSDSETDADDINQHDPNGKSLKEPDINSSLLWEECGYSHDSLFKDNEDSDTDSGGEMVDGIISSGPKCTYELPSQAELIRRAFAGDDVEDDFVREKEAVLDEENPKPEKPVLIPGWGQWSNIQKKRGLPSWMLEEHETAECKRLESLKMRKDAHLNNVIISQKLDKKAEKLHTKTLPYPYTSKEVFEQSMRIPIGPEFNPATAIGSLNCPEVVKKVGTIIKPIQYEDLSVHERGETCNCNSWKQGKGKEKSGSRK